MHTLIDTHGHRHIHELTQTWTHLHSHTHGHTQTRTQSWIHICGHILITTQTSGHVRIGTLTDTHRRARPQLSLAPHASLHLPLDLRLDRQTDPSPEEQAMNWLGIFLGPVAPTALSVPPQAQLVRRMWSARSQTHRGCLGGLRPTHPSVPAVRRRRGLVNQDDLQSPWDTQGQSWECVLAGGAWKTFPK